MKTRAETSLITVVTLFPVRTTFPPVTPISCAPASSGPPDLGSPFSSPAYYLPEDPNLNWQNVSNDPNNFVQFVDSNFVQSNDPNSVQMNDPTFQPQDPNFVQPEVYHVSSDSGFVTCTVPGCPYCNLGHGK